MIMRYTPNTLEANILKPRDAVGHIVGNFLILSRAGNGRVKAKCLLCGNKNFETHWCKIKSGHTTSDGCKHKMMNPEQYIGKVYGKLTVLKIVPEKDNGAVQAKFQCECGVKTVKVLNAVQRSKILSCGCGGRTRGGLSSGENKLIYAIWRQMLARCYQSGSYVTNNPRLKFLTNTTPHPRYSDYGARGIQVAKEWHSLDTFVTWHKKNIQTGESMDRIDNDMGYFPRNIKSANNEQQSRNQRIRKDNRLGLKGVIKTPTSYGWTIRHDKARHKREGYRYIEQALLARNLYIIENDLPHAIQVPMYPHELNIVAGNKNGHYNLVISDTRGGGNFSLAKNWPSKQGPVLVKLVNAMKKAYLDSCGLD